MKSLVLICALAACGGKQSTGTGTGTGSDENAGVVEDTRTPFELRLDAACDALGPRLTQCAVDDSKAELAAGRITQQQFADLTSDQMRHALDKDWANKCNKADRSSRQVRVLEVCHAEETACSPLLDCLENLNKEPAK
ncbi:MAG: hypothetical protein H0T42_05735 [Deltaproteobacteria bacterium]|nr:hypothetical protein [Deltaproteobacteria bacterium]